MKHNLPYLKWLVCAYILMSINLMSFANIQATITGPDVVCRNQIENYSVSGAPSGSNLNWFVSNGTLLSPPNASTIAVSWSGTGAAGQVQVQVLDGTILLETVVLDITIEDEPQPLISADFNSDCLPDNNNPEPDQKRDSLDCFTACEDMLINYSTPDISGNTYLWTVIGDYQSITGASTSTASVLWDEPGPALVVVTETSPAGCINSDTICVEVIPKPASLFEVQQGGESYLSVLSGGIIPVVGTCVESELCFSDMSTDAVAWQWDFGDGNSSIEQHPCHSFSTAGTYMVSLTVQNECQCTETTFMEVHVEEGVAPEISCVSVICEAGTFVYEVSIPNPCSSGIFTWTTSDNGTITNASGTVTSMSANEVTGSDIYTIEVDWSSGPIGSIGFSLTGCPGVCDQFVSISIPIIPSSLDIEGDSVVCIGDKGYFNIPCFPGTTYKWYIDGDPITGESGHDMWHQFDIPGTYEITVSYQNAYLNCGGISQPFVVTVLPSFSIWGPQQFCQGETPVFNAPAAGTYDWELLDAGNAVVATGSGGSGYTVPALIPGNYILTAYDVSSPRSYCNEKALFPFTVIETPPTPGPLSGENQVCHEMAYLYSASPFDANHYLNWIVTNDGSVTNYTGNEITVVWEDGPKLIQLVQVSTTGGCPSDTFSMLINEKTLPPLNVSGAIAPCNNTELGAEIIYGTTATLDGYIWSISPITAGSINGGQGTSSVAVLWNNFTGVANVILEPILCNDTLDADTLLVNVIGPDSISISGPDTICEGTSTTWNTSGATGVTWEVKNALTGSTVYTYSGTPLIYDFNTYSGSFVLIATGTDLSCGKEVKTTHQVHVLPKPIANLSFAGSLNCISLTGPTTLYLSIQGSAAPYSYDWFGGASAGSGTSYVIPASPSSADSYYVEVTDSNGCTATTNIIPVSDSCMGVPCVPPGPEISFTYSIDTDCKTVQFTPTSSPSLDGFLWEFANLGVNNTVYAPSFTFPASGAYTVHFSVLYPGSDCWVKYTEVIEVPVVSDFEIAIECVANNHVVNLLNTTNVLNGPLSSWTHNWTVYDLTVAGTASSSVLQDYVSVSGLIPGNDYEITLNVSGTGGSCSVNKLFSMPELPEAIFSADDEVCEGGNISFTDASVGSIIDWSWAFGDGSGMQNQNTSKTYEDDGLFSVVLTVTDEFACSDDSSLDITVHENELLGGITTDPMPLCPGDVAVLSFNNLSPSGNAPFNYLWNSGSLTTTTTSSFMSTHWINVTDAKGCARDFGPAQVWFENIPDVYILGDLSYCFGEEVSLASNIPASSSYSLEWFMNNGSGWNSVSSGATLIIPFLSPGTYDVRLEISAGGCTVASPIVVVEVYPYPGIPNIVADTAPACPDMGVGLSVSNATDFASITWSTGESGVSTTAWSSGLYYAHGIDTNGCEGEGVYFIEPLPDLCGFMCGCYEDCIEPGGVFTFPAGIIGAVAYWRWERYDDVSGNWIAVSDGTGAVPDYTTSSAGIHEIRLYVENASGCGVYSCHAEIHITICGTEPCHGFEIDAHALPCKTDAVGNIIYPVEASLGFNAFGTPCDEYVLSASASLGVVSAISVSNVSPGVSNNFTFTWSPGTTSYPGGTICVTFTITNVCDSSICEETVCFDVEPCGDQGPCVKSSSLVFEPCKTNSAGEVVYPFTLTINLTGSGAPCTTYQLFADVATGTISGLSTTTISTGTSTTVTGIWNAGVTSFAGGTVCFDLQLINSCDQRICEETVCGTVEPCHSSEPCDETELYLSSVICSPSTGGDAGFEFDLNINLVPFGLQCDEYIVNISAPYGVATVVGSSVITPGSIVLNCYWDTELPSVDNQEVCFDVTFTNNCDQTRCTNEVCYGFKSCHGDVTSNQEELQWDLSVYPNPVHSKFSVRSDLPLEQIELFDLNGKLQMSTLINGAKESDIPVAVITKGAYILHVTRIDGTIKYVPLLVD